ncbi:hypothetical protein KUTeg_001288 [Tegillarca granosa]|uniref:EMI domain-containing protein n=1 Tax=Tegillarca granosa TaxID=220873 RepID=A0ABQ9FZN2_TEGGR|nr:hypothetical protein KUTeg_001288 [Tegillarca granosa]
MYLKNSNDHCNVIKRRICPERKAQYELVPIKQTYTRPFYTRNCRLNNTCDRSQVIYKTAVRTIFYKRVVHNLVKKCCPGWQMNNPRDRGCMKRKFLYVCRTN